MLALGSLQSLYKKQIGGLSSCFEKAIAKFIEFPLNLSEVNLEECTWQEPFFSEDIALQNWKLLLAFNLLCHLTEWPQEEIASKVRSFERHPWNQSSQYFRVLVALNHAFAKMPIPEVGAHLLESGAALVDLYEFCPWLSLPYHPHHMEFGLFLCLLALLTKRQSLGETIGRLARWQLNTLDATGRPISGLFVREKDGKPFEQLCITYLFYRSAALLIKEPLFSAIAEEALKGIHEGYSIHKKINPLWPLIEKWLEQFSPLSPNSLKEGEKLRLQENIYDPSTSLVGYRSSAQHVVCTLHGGHTGLGVLRYGDIGIVNYGPQYLPLGDCQGFGIEGNSLSDQGMRRSIIEWRPHTFCIKGCTRLVDQPSNSPFEMGLFRGIWCEVVQEFKKPHFYLKTNFLGLDGWDSVVFSFYVKASRCMTQSQECLLPRKLERYEGAAQTVTFDSEESALDLRPLSFKGKMEVIPLAGGDNFWGADFLVSYHLSPDQGVYQWHIGPPRSSDP